MRTESDIRRRELFNEVRAIIDRADDQVPFVELLGLQSSNEGNAGNAQRAKEILQHARTLAAGDPRARTDTLFSQTILNAFALGELAELEASTVRYEQAVSAAGPHVRMHPQRGRALVALCRADWNAVRAVARHVARTIDAHPETVFCIVAAAPLGWGASAAAISGDLAEARDLLARARRIAAQPNTTEGFLAEAFAALGLRGDVLRLDESLPVDAWPNTIAPALAAIGEWDRMLPRLAVLERRAANSDRFCGAMAAALREELAARDGGPPARHEALRQLGYVGFSELLRFRPAREA
jgi:hypothetical protein